MLFMIALCIDQVNGFRDCKESYLFIEICLDPCVFYPRAWIMPWWQEEMLHPLVHRLLPRSTRYLIGQRSQKKACCSLLTRLMHLYASKLPILLHIASSSLMKNVWNSSAVLLIMFQQKSSVWYIRLQSLLLNLYEFHFFNMSSNYSSFIVILHWSNAGVIAYIWVKHSEVL